METISDQLILTDEVDVPSDVNKGLTVAPPEFMESILGCPRKTYTADCQNMTNRDLYNTHIVLEDVGPFTARGLRPAVTSLKEVLADVAREQQEVYESLGVDAMLCCRYMGKRTKVSNHSWGIAIDLLLNGRLDPYNNGKTFYGLTLIAPIFNRHGWFWGGKYRTSEDAMHFEVSKEKLVEWQRAGMFRTIASHRYWSFSFLQRGDQGPMVAQLQNALAARNYKITSDGRFGKYTELAVIDFQRKHGLPANGTVGLKTAVYLALF